MKAFFRRYYATRTRRTALLISLGAGAFFAALLCVMFYLRWASEEWPAPFNFASLLMVTGLTGFGLAASTTFEVGASAVGLPDREPAVRWIAVGIATWLTFLFLELIEWIRLVYLVQLGPDTAFGSTFLALTGAHWIAVCFCVAWMTWAANDTRRRDVLAAAIFSHFLCLVWLVLVATLYLPNTDIEGFA